MGDLIVAGIMIGGSVLVIVVGAIAVVAYAILHAFGRLP